MPLGHAPGGMQPHPVPVAQNWSGWVSGEAFSVDGDSDGDDLKNINSPQSNPGFCLHHRSTHNEPSSGESLSVCPSSVGLEVMGLRSSSQSVHLPQLIQRLNLLSCIHMGHSDVQEPGGMLFSPGEFLSDEPGSSS